jgi:hypothetical protein
MWGGGGHMCTRFVFNELVHQYTRPSQALTYRILPGMKLTICRCYQTYIIRMYISECSGA